MSTAEKIYTNIHQDLIDRCRHQDRRAQFEIYKLYYRAMYNTSLRIVNNTQEAEDIMQEAFLAAFDKIDDYREKVSFGAWLKKIVVNKSLDALRKKRIEFVDPETQNLNITATDEKEEEPDYDTESIRRALEQLPAGYRTILTLYLFEGYDHEEIAGILGISNATSRSQYFRARQKLKDLLKKSMNHG